MKIIETYLVAILMSYLIFSLYIFIPTKKYALYYGIVIICAIIFETAFAYIEISSQKITLRQVIFYLINTGLILILLFNFMQFNYITYYTSMLLHVALFLQIWTANDSDFIDYDTFLSRIVYYHDSQIKIRQKLILDEFRKLGRKYLSNQNEIYEANTNAVFPWFPFFLFKKIRYGLFDLGIIMAYPLILRYHYTDLQKTYLIFFTIFYLSTQFINRWKIKNYAIRLAKLGWLKPIN